MARELPIGIGTTFDYSIPLEPMCRMLAKAGFSAITLGGGNIAHSGYDTLDGRAAILRAARETGLKIDSVHAPFGRECDLSLPDERIPIPPAAPAPTGAIPDQAREPEPPDQPAPTEPWPQTQEPAAPEPQVAPQAPRYRHVPRPERLHALDRVRNAIDAAQALGSGIVIIHAAPRFPAEETRSRLHALRHSLDQLLPYAGKRDVRLALENLDSLVSQQLFEPALEEFPELGVCFDSSHAQVAGHTFSILQRHAARIIALHISDNRGELDDHLLPFEGVIDWDEFAIYFRRCTAVRTFMLEVETRESQFKDTTEFLAQAFVRARQLLSL
jgi:sugar phosphate isomerase/epimerase